MESLSNFFSKSNIDILEALVNESLSVRDLAKKTSCSPAKITQFIKLFREDGLIKLENDKNKKIVSLQRNSLLLREIISLIFIRELMASKALSALKNNAKAIGVYGSIAEGNVDSKSDIDLWVLADKKPSLVESGKIRMELSKELGREASIRFMTAEDVKKLKKKDSIFYNELEYKSKILLGEGLGG